MKSNCIIQNNLIQYEHFLAKGSKTILFLHGWRSEGSIWHDIAMELQKEKCNVFTLDLPGFGGSSVPGKVFTVTDYATIVSDFIEKMKIKKVILVGHSFGGRVALRVTSTNSTHIEKLVLVDSAGFVQKEKQLLKRLSKLVKPVFAPSYMQGIRKKIYTMLGAEDYLATPELQKTFVNIVGEDLSADMPRIQVPTLLIWGSQDTDTPLLYGEKMKGLISHSQLIVIPDAGHFSFLDKPKEFYTALMNFV